MLKTFVLLNIFVETVKISVVFDIESSKEQRLFKIKIFCNIINVFTAFSLSTYCILAE